MMITLAAPTRIRVRLASLDNYSRSRREPRMIVLHSTEGHEGGGPTDDNVAAGWAVPRPAGARTSCHYVVDADTITRCVPDMLTAWHAGHTANLIGIGIELCGTARQTAAEWLDPVSLATLGLAARLCVDLCDEFKIPAVYLDAATLNASNPRGITTHAAVSEAWRESTHWDPGPHFPIAEFIAVVAGAVKRRPPPLVG